MSAGDGSSPTDWILFGLGNPGVRYQQTRHNLGYLLVDQLCRRHKLTLLAGRADFFHARGEVDGRRFHLVKPTTYMNLSGRAVRQYLAIERPERPEILAAVDDTQIPLGRLRLRPKGSAGGHNGLKSIEEHLRTRDYARLRMGCGPVPEGEDMADFVLEDFLEDEWPHVETMVAKAADAFENWVIEGPVKTMGRFNG